MVKAVVVFVVGTLLTFVVTGELALHLGLPDAIANVVALMLGGLTLLLTARAMFGKGGRGG